MKEYKIQAKEPKETNDIKPLGNQKRNLTIRDQDQRGLSTPTWPMF